MKIRQEDVDRFWKKIDFTDTCWLYTGTKSSKKSNYYVFWIDGGYIGAHRFSYTIHNEFKMLTPDDFVCHKCDVPRCVNPEHLWLGTAKENSEDMVSKGRCAIHTGSLNNAAILDEADVLNILNGIYNNTYKNINQITDEFDVEYNTVRDILYNKTWTHITNKFEISLKDLRNKIIDSSANKNTAKLTKDSVYDIRIKIKNGSTDTYLASIYQVHPTTIGAIRLNKTWKTVKI